MVSDLRAAYGDNSGLCNEAADEIERLRKHVDIAAENNSYLETQLCERETDNERLRVALREIRDQLCGCDAEWKNCPSCIARSALDITNTQPTGSTDYE